MKLLVFKNGNLEQELKLDSGSTYVVGRKETCDIKLEKLPGISREHFQVEEDESGYWKVQVLSKVTYLAFEGQETQEIPLDEGVQFSLHPYTFQFTSGDSAAMSPPIVKETPVESEEDAFIDEPVDFSTDDGMEKTPEINNDISEKTFMGNEEKTAIQNFAGIPYIKLIGQNGKKSEFFRLEGNLWLAGRDDSASIYLSDPSAVASHFEISKTDKGFFINDLASVVGTILNGQRLDPHTATQLQSGDIVNVGDQSLQFELRDQAFKKKVSNIPLHMYQNPLVFFDQETAMVSTDNEDYGSGRVEEVQMEEEGPKKKKVFLMAIAAVAVLAAVVVNFMDSGEKEKVVQTESADPFSKLDPAQQKIVVQTHTLAKQLYLNGNFELALVQIQKLHSIIPEYKDSKEMEEYCINSRDLKRQQALIEQQKREQEMMEKQIASYIAQCSQRFSNSYDLDGAKACLAPALNMDPNNAEISQIFADITARQEEKRIRQKIAQEQADKVRRGKELFERARQYHRKNNFFKAIEAYENHIHSGLPDPSKLVKQSKRNLSSIEYLIRTKKNNLMGTAQQKYDSSQLRDAVKFAREAQKVDPYDYTISAFLEKIEAELTSKVKGIYMDSVIEERFGNIEASRIKWEEIVRIDVENGKYYKKAEGKLKQYGFKH